MEEMLLLTPTEYLLPLKNKASPCKKAQSARKTAQYGTFIAKENAELPVPTASKIVYLRSEITRKPAQTDSYVVAYNLNYWNQ